MGVTSYDKDGNVTVGDCRTDRRCLDKPDLGCVSTGPECCPPKCTPDPCPPFHARDALRIRDFEVERIFDIRSVCGDEDFFAIQHCIRMEFKKPCDCDWRWPTDALRVTSDGKVVFRWPTCFLNALPGYWYSRLLIDGHPVKYIPLYKPFMKVNVHSTEPVIGDRCRNCDEPASNCGCSKPEVDQDDWEESFDCGGCRK